MLVRAIRLFDAFQSEDGERLPWMELPAGEINVASSRLFGTAFERVSHYQERSSFSPEPWDTSICKECRPGRAVGRPLRFCTPGRRPVWVWARSAAFCLTSLPMFYVIAYDVASDRRRKRIADFLRTYGLPVQLSMVECELSNAELNIVRTKLAELINSRRDRISIYPQCQRCSSASEHLGLKISQVLRNL